MNSRVRYPLGIQTFSEVIKGGYLYIDKTEYVYNMTHNVSKYIFLSRPRRFGKSLLTSTLRSYFEGRKELFKGLAIEKLENEWTEHPVIHIDLASAKNKTPNEVKGCIQAELKANAERLGVEIDQELNNLALIQLIGGTYHKYNKRIALLVDNYDAPLIDLPNEDKDAVELRHILSNFYAPLKASDPELHFVFLTGSTKFSQDAFSSVLNNIKNISLLEDFGSICGITQEEMLTQMNEGIEALAQKQQMTKEEAIEALKDNYDGYHFTWPSADVYNPYSLLNAMVDRALSAYWFSSGTPTYLIEMLRKYGVLPSELNEPMKAMATDFDAPTENMTSITPLLYQSGYITIKNYSKVSRVYTLSIPNNEIRLGLFESLLPNYVFSAKQDGNTTAALMQEALHDDNIDEMLGLLQKFLGTVPQTDNTGYEGHWQQVLYIIFALMGASVDVEVRTPRGRVDLVARTAQKLYLLELKLNKSAEAAMNQIDLKNYPERFALCGLPVTKIGVNFDMEVRNITEWKVEEV